MVYWGLYGSSLYDLFFNCKVTLTMPSYKDIYKTAFLSAKILKTKKIKSTISACYVETVGKKKDERGDKIVIEVENGETRVALNKGNAAALGKKFGEDFNSWVGKRVTIQTHETAYMGEPVLGLQVVPG